MKNNWLWDRKITFSRAKKILKDPKNKRFIHLAALLLARNNEPKEVFGNYLDPLLFCRYWAVIKKRMRKDEWSQPRIIFWQTIYEHLRDRYHKKGIVFRKEVLPSKSPLCEKMGRQISNIRKEQRLSQKELAKKLGVSQQLISRVEKGRENISLYTLNSISHALGRKVEIRLT